MRQTTKPKASVARPDIFGYHDYRVFLKDWLAYLKASQSFSMRGVAKAAGLASGYLPMVLAGQRELSPKTCQKLRGKLKLSPSEESYLGYLVKLGTSDSQEERVEALAEMKRFHLYQRQNPREIEVYQYLTHWYYVAIREMAALPDFKLDPEWIQSRLRVRVESTEIKAALRFLLENGYLEQASNGTVRHPEKNIDCFGGVFRVALTKFHHELLTLASRSITETPGTERHLLGHTFSLGAEQFDEARRILDEALDKLRELEKNRKQADSVYHAEMALFPFTKRKGSKEVQ